MCLFFPPPPAKRRYPATAFEDPRPRKRRVTYQQLPTHARYEPLRGHGVRRDPPTIAVASSNNNPNILRGHGAKREPLRQTRQEPELKVHFAASVPVVEHRSSRPAHVRQRPRYQATRAPVEHRRKSSVVSQRDVLAEYQQQQYQSSLTAATSNPLYMAQVQQQQPMHDYRVPASYYTDLTAVRAATNEALQAAVYQPAANTAQYRAVRRRPAYTRLRYEV